MREQVIQSHNPEEAESLLASLETLHGAEEPMNREWRTALRQRGAAVLRLWDILMHVPEAWRRYQLIERLVKIRRSPGGGGGRVWGAGLSTDEIEWQVKMADKYGIGAHYPEAETAAREAARQREDWTHRNLVSDYFSQGSPLE